MRNTKLDKLDIFLGLCMVVVTVWGIKIWHADPSSIDTPVVRASAGEVRLELSELREDMFREDKWNFKHCTPTNKDCGRLE
jgi:hypothetical protein